MKIEPIRLCRETFGVGLAEAKEAVERMERGESVDISGMRVRSARVASAADIGQFPNPVVLIYKLRVSLRSWRALRGKKLPHAKLAKIAKVNPTRLGHWQTEAVHESVVLIYKLRVSFAILASFAW